MALPSIATDFSVLHRYLTYEARPSFQLVLFSCCFAIGPRGYDSVAIIPGLQKKRIYSLLTPYIQLSKKSFNNLSFTCLMLIRARAKNRGQSPLCERASEYATSLLAEIKALSQRSARSSSLSRYAQLMQSANLRVAHRKSPSIRSVIFLHTYPLVTVDFVRRARASRGSAARPRECTRFWGTIGLLW